MEAVIEVEGLTKHYGKLVAVDHISFAVEKGDFFGFLGPNGAGKTTTVRMLTGVAKPTAGTARVRGFDIRKKPVEARRGLGIVPEMANIYVDISVWQNLMLAAELYHIPRQKRKQKAEELLELFGLSERRDTKGRELSRGLKQRVLICMALVVEPSILFLDEPTRGLDVAGARLIRQMVREVNQKGVTVFLTTHNMDEAEEICSRLAIITHGRIAAIDTPEALKSRRHATQSVEVSFKQDQFGQPDFGSIPHVSEVKRRANLFKLYTDRPGHVAQEIVRKATEAKLEIQSIRTCRPTLEEIYLEVVEGAPAEGEVERERRRRQRRMQRFA